MRCRATLKNRLREQLMAFCPRPTLPDRSSEVPVLNPEILCLFSAKQVKEIESLSRPLRVLQNEVLDMLAPAMTIYEMAEEAMERGESVDPMELREWTRRLIRYIGSISHRLTLQRRIQVLGTLNPRLKMVSSKMASRCTDGKLFAEDKVKLLKEIVKRFPQLTVSQNRLSARRYQLAARRPPSAATWQRRFPPGPHSRPRHPAAHQSPGLEGFPARNPAPASAPISPGPRAPGLLGGQPLPGGVGGPRNQDLQLPKRRPTPGKRYQCSGDGCRLACRSMKELLDHMRVHYRPTQSVEGKAFRCSAHGCAESFPDMQALMGHVKAHYKLNRYFKCENCMSRFQTYRSLFKHLHSCTDSATSSPSPAPAAEKPVSVPPPGLEGDPVGTPPEELPKLQSSVRQNALLPGPMEAALAADPLPASLRGALESVPALAHSFPLLEQPLFGPPSLARFSGPPPPPVAGPFLPFVHSTTYGLPQAAVQSRLRPLLPAPGLPVSNAVWKKSQGHSSNSRIVWEHTRGRYTCMQCPYSTASREEMTQHIDDHRKNPSPPGRLEADAEQQVHLLFANTVEEVVTSPLTKFTDDSKMGSEGQVLRIRQDLGRLWK
ncbi:hypothetical protein EYD10_10795 [Varanus komodoensis]|nr:hypothetical protein EYD10_10795 [Varanus komodoensis]